MKNSFFALAVYHESNSLAYFYAVYLYMLCSKFRMAIKMKKRRCLSQVHYYPEKELKILKKLLNQAISSPVQFSVQ